MKIFLTASTYGKQELEKSCHKIVELTKKNGHTIEADHISLLSNEKINSWTPDEELTFFSGLIEKAKNCDAVFAETSYPSTSVGYLLALVAEAGKPVVCFYSGLQKPHLFNSLEEMNDKFTVAEYKNIDDLEKLVPDMLDFIQEGQDTRFNFFVTPTHINYLNWVAKTRRIPRSVFLRKLIEREMKDSDEFNSTN